jgi:signal transduction histidine kinase/sugar lactone lactonase YvrE
LPDRISIPIGQLDFLLASRGGGFWRISDGRIVKYTVINLVQDLGPCPWVRTPDVVKAACEDREGNLIVGTHGQGVFWFDAQGRFTRLCTSNGLANDSILSLVVDSGDNLWVGMDGGGPTRRSLNRVTCSIFNLLEPTTGQVIQSVSEDRFGRLWYSAKDNDFCFWKDGVKTSVGSSFGTLNRFNPRAIMVDSNQNIWAATMGVNLFRFSGNQFRPVPGAAEILNRFVSTLYSGHDGRIWVGTQGGLGCWDGQSWRNLTTNDGLTGNIVRAVADDAAGNVWVGIEHGGLDLLQGAKVTAFQKNGGFPSDNISCLYMDKSGVLWVGTIGNGLVQLDHGQWKHYTTQNGLAGNSIDYIIEDDQGFLWIGSNAGLMRVRKQELEEFDPAGPDVLSCRGYDIKDGLPATECASGSQPAACRTSAGLLWFPTIAGMVSVNPAQIQPDTNPPPVAIESVLIDQQLQGSNGFRTRPPQSITVPADRENLEIHYTSLNLAAAGRDFFRYRLEGYQTGSNHWTVAGRDRFVRYLNLPHGDYRFEVEARTQDGPWNPVGANLDVLVLPPFWETGWFRAVAAVSLLGLIIGTVYFISTQRLQRQLAVLRAQQALEKERARIARDIHDQVGASLTQLSLLAEMVQADKDRPAEAESHARQISQTARETALELDEIVWTVNPSNDTLDGLVNYICKHAEDYFAVAGLRYRLDVPAELPSVPISPEARHNIFLAAKESVTNVVRHARASEVWLRLRLTAHDFSFEIEDNGRGPAGLKEKAAESRNGLRNMRKRMEDIGGGFFIGPGRQGGTLVRLTVPLRND